MKKPRNLPSYPVYSLITQDIDMVINYNIMTYIIPVSMKPKHYIISIYKGTKTLENWLYNKKGILQILSSDNLSLVGVLGKKSGKNYNKFLYLNRKKLIDNFGIILNIAGYLEIEEISQIGEDSGDHLLFLCKVKKYMSFKTDVLTTHILEEKNIIL